MKGEEHKKKFHSKGNELALRQLTTAIIGNMAAKPSSSLQQAIGPALLSKHSKNFSTAVEAASLETNPLEVFGGENGGGSKPRLTDAELREILRSHCREARNPCAREDVLWRLDGSLARACRQDCRLQIYAESTVHHRTRVHYPKPGVGVGHSNKLTDRCRDCRCWDKVVEPMVINVVADGIELLQQQFPPYWKKWIDICNRRGYNAPGFQKCESVEFMVDMVQYIQDHPDVYANERAGAKEFFFC